MKPQNKFQKAFCKLPDILFSLMMIGILFICLFLSKMNSIRIYLGISEHNQLLLLFVGIFFTGIIVCTFQKLRLLTHIKINKVFFFGAFLICFIFQLIATYHYYFTTDWDVGVVFGFSSAIAHKEDLSTFIGYFSRYPNNLVLSYVFASIIKVVHHFGLHNYEYFSLIIVQCFLNTITGLLIVSAIKQLFHNDVLCAIGYLCYFFLIGISPWVIVPYSDSMVLIFPVLILNIYLIKTKQAFELPCVVKWFCIALLSYIGYKIKPQIIILFLGIVIAELYRSIVETGNYKLRLKQAMTYLLAIVIGFSTAMFLTNIMKNQIPIELEAEQAFGPTHFFMMGMNPEAHGHYSGDDVLYSASFSTVSERKRANIKTAFDRIKTMGRSGLMNQIIYKTLINYDDGTFYWGGEGTFYTGILPEKNHYISSFFRNLYYNRDCKGKYYSIWANFEQMIWLTVLFFAMLSGFFARDKRITVVMITIIGLTLFELIFEARARYLFAYVPLYIILAVCGIKFLLDKWEKHQKRKISKA